MPQPHDLSQDKFIDVAGMIITTITIKDRYKSVIELIASYGSRCTEDNPNNYEETKQEVINCQTILLSTMRLKPMCARYRKYTLMSKADDLSENDELELLS